MATRTSPDVSPGRSAMAARKRAAPPCRDLDPLGLPRRTRGVEHVGEVLRAGHAGDSGEGRGVLAGHQVPSRRRGRAPARRPTAAARPPGAPWVRRMAMPPSSSIQLQAVARIVGVRAAGRRPPIGGWRGGRRPPPASARRRAPPGAGAGTQLPEMAGEPVAPPLQLRRPRGARPRSGGDPVGSGRRPGRHGVVEERRPGCGARCRSTPGGAAGACPAVRSGNSARGWSGAASAAVRRTFRCSLHRPTVTASKRSAGETRKLPPSRPPPPSGRGSGRTWRFRNRPRAPRGTGKVPGACGAF